MRSVMVGTALLLAAAAGAAAQVRPGLNELNLNGDIAAISAGGDTETMIHLQLRYGRFITRQVEVGPVLSATKVQDVDLFGSVGGFGALHFGAEGATSVPYVGLGLETGFGSEGDNPFTYGGFAGIKFFVGQAGAVIPEAYLSRTSRGDVDWTNYGLRVGVSIFM